MAEIEHNEARVKDLEIPLFELEQRVEKLENTFSSYQMDKVSELSQLIGVKLQNGMREFMPKVHQMALDFKGLKDMVQMRLEMDIKNEELARKREEEREVELTKI